MDDVAEVVAWPRLEVGAHGVRHREQAACAHSSYGMPTTSAASRSYTRCIDAHAVPRPRSWAARQKLHVGGSNEPQ